MSRGKGKDSVKKGRIGIRKKDGDKCRRKRIERSSPIDFNCALEILLLTYLDALGVVVVYQYGQGLVSGARHFVDRVSCTSSMLFARSV